MVNVILWILVGLILGGAILYIVKAKKKGVQCIGCPMAGKCSGSCGSYGTDYGPGGSDCRP